jgi:uracil DNA glycosylase
LTAWSTRAGVLLLNATLQGHKTGYNAWRPFVSRAIQIVCGHGPRGFIFMGAQEPRELSVAVVGPSRACFVETPYPAQFTRDDFNELQPFASVNRKLVAASAEPVRWNALLD